MAKKLDNTVSYPSNEVVDNELRVNVTSLEDFEKLLGSLREHNETPTVRMNVNSYELYRSLKEEIGNNPTINLKYAVQHDSDIIFSIQNITLEEGVNSTFSKVEDQL